MSMRRKTLPVQTNAIVGFVDGEDPLPLTRSDVENTVQAIMFGTKLKLRDSAYGFIKTPEQWDPHEDKKTTNQVRPLIELLGGIINYFKSQFTEGLAPNGKFVVCKRVHSILWLPKGLADAKITLIQTAAKTLSKKLEAQPEFAKWIIDTVHELKIMEPRSTEEITHYNALSSSDKVKKDARIETLKDVEFQRLIRDSPSIQSEMNPGGFFYVYYKMSNMIEDLTVEKENEHKKNHRGNHTQNSRPVSRGRSSVEKPLGNHNAQNKRSVSRESSVAKSERMASMHNREMMNHMNMRDQHQNNARRSLSRGRLHY
jgi:hypothetical protein